MNYHSFRQRSNRGIAPLIIILIAVAVLAAAGGGYVVATRTGLLGQKMAAKPAPAGPGAAGTGQTAAAATGVDSIQIAAPSFDFSFSPVPSLEASAFNVGSPSVASAAGAFSGLNIKADLSVDTDLNVALPEIDTADLMPTTLAQPATPPATEPPPAAPPSGGGSGTTVNQSSCAQFAAMPSAQYCSQVGDPNGRTLCEQCKAAGY